MKQGYQVTCPSNPTLTGFYEMTVEDTFQLKDTPFVLARNAADNLWCITDGERFVVTSFDSADTPSGVKFWKVKGSKGFVRDKSMTVVKPEVHKGVTCDGCKAEPILGVRYNCAGREDYDLCCACEAKEIQPYPMLKIYKHDQRPSTFKYTCEASADIKSIKTETIQDDACHIGTSCSSCQVGPIRGVRFKCVVRAGYDLCSACEASTAENGSHPHAMVKIYDPRHMPVQIEYIARETAGTATDSSADGESENANSSGEKAAPTAGQEDKKTTNPLPPVPSTTASTPKPPIPPTQSKTNKPGIFTII